MKCLPAHLWVRQFPPSAAATLAPCTLKPSRACPTRITGDQDRQADWHCGREIGLLIVGGLMMVIVNVLLGGLGTPVVAELYPEWRS